jgi:hypothetical protein
MINLNILRQEKHQILVSNITKMHHEMEIYLLLEWTFPSSSLQERISSGHLRYPRS